jgi:anaerobic selenocysteine-containing dehydrogenase
MIQTPRFSGKWKRISWEEAIQIISNKIVKIKNTHGNYLPIGYMKGGGNYGILSESTKGLFTSLCHGDGSDGFLLVIMRPPEPSARYFEELRSVR